MTKIAIETCTEHNDKIFCQNTKGQPFGCRFLRAYPWRCIMFTAKDGSETKLRTKDGIPKRCQKCIDAEIGDGK